MKRSRLEVFSLGCARIDLFKFSLPSVVNDNVIMFCKSGLKSGNLRIRTTTETKRETLNIRIKADVRDLIDRAA